MLPKIDFTTTRAYPYLCDHYINISEKNIKELFEKDSQRFQKFSILQDDFLLDFSKNHINDETLALLLQLARECELEKAIEAMFEGQVINETENRAVLH